MNNHHNCNILVPLVSSMLECDVCISKSLNLNLLHTHVYLNLPHHLILYISMLGTYLHAHVYIVDVWWYWVYDMSSSQNLLVRRLVGVYEALVHGFHFVHVFTLFFPSFSLIHFILLAPSLSFSRPVSSSFKHMNPIPYIQQYNLLLWGCY